MANFTVFMIMIVYNIFLFYIFQILQETENKEEIDCTFYLSLFYSVKNIGFGFYQQSAKICDN